MSKSAPLRLGFVPIVRPLFLGASMGLWESSRDALASLGLKLGFDLAFVASPVTDAAEAAREAKAAQAADLDLLIVQHTTFATGDTVMPFLDGDLPLAVWGMPEVQTTGRLPQNSLCGVNMTLSLPSKRRVPAKWFFGRADESEFAERLAVTVRALRGRRALRTGRLLQVGGVSPGFFRLENVPDLALKIDRLPLDEALASVSRVPQPVVAAALDAVDEPTPMTRSALEPAIRLELALGELAKGYDGVAMRCWPEVPERCGAVACAAFARQSDRGTAFACEGDVAGLASMLAVSAVTDSPAALLDLVHIEGDALMFWHCGNVPRAWAAGGKTRLDPHFNRKIAAVRDMRLRAGPVSGLRLLEDGRAMIYAGDVEERESGYDGVSGWVSRLRWAGQAATAQGFLGSVLNHRLPHHFTWGFGDHEPALLELADWLGLSVLPPAPVAREVGAAAGMVRWSA